MPPQQALQTLLDRLDVSLPRASECISLTISLGRTTSTDIISPETLPAFPRSTVDGFSVNAIDTFGATPGLPSYLEIIGEISMGKPPSISLNTGQTAVTYTGGMLAGRANAVVMIEDTQQIDEHTVEVLRPVAVGENMVHPGEDVHAGDKIIAQGKIIRPQDIGALQSVGINYIRASKKPRVALLSMGDEVISSDQTPIVGQIRDINTHTISAMISQSGGVPIPLGIARDDFDEQLKMAKSGLSEADILVFSAGSSVSIRDITADIINALGDPGVIIHGLSLKPGKPAIIGIIDQKPVFGLPGNPVSAMIVFDLLIRPTIYQLAGCKSPPEPATILAQLGANIPSAPGREDYMPVKLENADVSIIAHPILGKSNLIYTLARADGLVQVPIDKSGLYEGDFVKVRLF
ncbi:MAG: gephyrin-like molybdotransferase Glp [Chloroflexota bacterium]|nr:gephyrin-like molybdotransferase Glp [Chloroflexota bacterium]